MKKLIVVFCILCVCVSFAYGCNDKPLYTSEEIYSLTTVVVDVNYETDIVTCEDFNGNAWDFYGCEDWLEGDICSMVMYNHGTVIIYDDEIINVRYCGWFEGWGDYQ